MRKSLMLTSENLEIVRRYLKSVENGAFSDVAPLFTPDVVMEQLPNRIYPQGLRATISQMAAAFEKGRKLLSSQTYEIKNAVINGDSIAVEVLWTGTLAVGFGTLTAGSQMRCHSSMFFEFKNGKICSQRNYDCFEPW
jgi:ketosteroid isomerase-like protein